MSALDEATYPMGGPLAVTLPGGVLAVVRGADAGLAVELRARSLTIGSAPDNDLVLADPAVSRHHVRFEAQGDRLWAIDLGSTNGTFVDGVQVREAAMRAGQRLDLGASTLELRPATRPLVIPLSDRRSFHGLVGGSPAMRELYLMLERAAPSQASVLLHGETGTGKELAAEALHEASDRAAGPFVVVDCGAIPPTLFESELFGHAKGAFTGATHDRVGLFAEAHGGTLFLDEIGELAPELQPKLLRALERRQVRPVGGSRALDVDVRVVAATHRDLAAQVNEGSFREDLYYRLAVVRLTLPPLRARREDIPELVARFVERLAPSRVADVPFVLAQLGHRSFPGNVRELRNAVEEILVLGAAAGLGPRNLSGAEAMAPSPGLDVRYTDLPYKEASELAARRFQEEYVRQLLAATHGNVSEAARRAGMSRRYLQTMMSRLGLGG